MADDGIFSQDELTAAATGAADPTPTPEEQQQAQRARDEQGRFVPKPPEGQQAAPEPEQRDDKGNVVPQGALHAEREKHKATKQELQAAKETLDAIAAMRAQVQGRQPDQQQPKPPEGDDPAAQIAYLKQRLEEVQGRQDSFDRTQQAAALDAQEDQHLAAALTTSEAEFRAQKPDYDAAINHVIQARAQELQLYGLTMPQINLTLQQEARDITRAAVQQGKSPAEVAYQLAQYRGYRPDASQGQQGGQQGGQGSAAATIEAIRAAQQGSRSLGQAAGSAAPKDLNAATIAAMSQDEFEALYSTPEGRRMIDSL